MGRYQSGFAYALLLGKFGVELRRTSPSDLPEATQAGGQLVQNKKMEENGGWIPKWSNGPDCKSGGFGLRRFESYSTHHFLPVY